MGFLSKAKQAMDTKLDDKVKQELALYILPSENIEHIFRAKEDFGALTNKRIIFMDKSLIGSKKTVIGVPYGKINAVGLNKGGFMSFSKEVVITIGSKVTEIDTYNSDMAIELYTKLSEKIV